MLPHMNVFVAIFIISFLNGIVNFIFQKRMTMGGMSQSCGKGTSTSERRTSCLTDRALRTPATAPRPPCPETFN